MKRLILPFLLLLNLALAAALGLLWFTPEGQSRLPAWRAPDPIAPALPAALSPASPAAEGGQTAFAALITERPLFAANRRPPAAPKAEAPPPPDPLDKTQINGILSGDITLVIATVEGRSRRLQLKDKIGAWELVRVADRGAIFSRDGNERNVPLTVASLRPTPTSAAAPDAGTSSTPTGTPAPTASAANAPSVGLPSNNVDQLEQARRERLQRRNEVRARAGLPPLPSN